MQGIKSALMVKVRPLLRFGLKHGAVAVVVVFVVAVVFVHFSIFVFFFSSFCCKTLCVPASGIVEQHAPSLSHSLSLSLFLSDFLSLSRFYNLTLWSCAVCWLMLSV